jgi:hypothetical protein
MDLISQLPFDLVSTKAITIHRADNAGAYVNMKWVPATKEDVVIQATVNERIKSEVTLILPDSLRTKKMVRLFSNSEIRQKEEPPINQDADDLTYKNEKYRVFKVECWDNVNGFSGWQAYAVKIDSQVLEVLGN